MILDQLILHKQAEIQHTARLSTIRSLRRTIVELRWALQNWWNNIDGTCRIRLESEELRLTLQNKDGPCSVEGD